MDEGQAGWLPCVGCWETGSKRPSPLPSPTSALISLRTCPPLPWPISVPAHSGPVQVQRELQVALEEHGRYISGLVRSMTTGSSTNSRSHSNNANGRNGAAATATANRSNKRPAPGACPPKPPSKAMARSGGGSFNACGLGATRLPNRGMGAPTATGQCAVLMLDKMPQSCRATSEVAPTASAYAGPCAALSGRTGLSRGDALPAPLARSPSPLLALNYGGHSLCSASVAPTATGGPAAFVGSLPSPLSTPVKAELCDGNGTGARGALPCDAFGEISELEQQWAMFQDVLDQDNGLTDQDMLWACLDLPEGQAQTAGVSAGSVGSGVDAMHLGALMQAKRASWDAKRFRLAA